MGTLRSLASSMAFRFVLVGIVIVGAVFVAIDLTSGGSTYRIKAVYSSAPGLFPGAAVDVLGVKVGTVTSVKNVGDTVHVELAVNSDTKVPAKAVASLVSPQLLGQPDVDLNPGYTGGATLSAGSTIPESRTAVPVSTDEVLKEVQRTLNALNPHAVGNLITNLAQDLDGQGAGLNKLIKGAAGTVQLLANKGNDLGQLSGTLGKLTGTLDSDTSQIEQLVSEYDSVSTVLAQRSPQLNDAITQLSGASTALVGLLTPNLAPLEADVGTVTQVGRTLDRNLGSVDEILQQGNNLFQGASRAYDSNYNWLNLNLALAPGVTGAYISGLLRDRLSGICRRLASNHATGLPASVLASLNECGNPSSGFFNSLLGDIPSILNTLNGSSASATGSALLQKGLDQILSIEPQKGGTVAVPNSATPTTPTTVPATTSTTAPTTTTTTAPKNAPASCGLLSKILGCPGATPAKSSGLAGLLSQPVTSKAAPASTVALDEPTLSAPAATMLPPLPSAQQRAHHHHRGLLAQWTHDVRSWF